MAQDTSRATSGTRQSAPHNDGSCPWCRRQVGPEGSARFMFCRISELGGGDTWVLCGFCNGTGLYAEWQKHPEYARQLADERLTKFKLVFP